MGGSDLAAGERAGGNLIEQRLEEVEIATVDDGDIEIGVGETLCEGEAAEAAAEDEDAMSNQCIHRGGSAAQRCF